MATTTKQKSTTAPEFSEAEKAAMKDRAAELKAAGKGGRKKAAEAEACVAKIAELSQPDRGIAERIHAIVTSAAPELDPKTWYGMPAYALDGKVVCFFKPAEKFGSRYATFGFEDRAAIDDGTMWPTSFGLTDLTDDDARLLEALVRRAVG